MNALQKRICQIRCASFLTFNIGVLIMAIMFSVESDTSVSEAVIYQETNEWS